MRRGVVILGAGAAGLGAAQALREAGAPFEVFEADDAPGGLARTDVVDGFSFERTGHVLHFKLREVEERFRTLGVALEQIERRAGILLGGTEIPYPFQYNLSALGSRRLARSVIADMKRASTNGRRNKSFAELLESLWGTRGVSLFFRPYNEKLWGRPLEELPPDCAGRFLPKSDIGLAEKGARQQVTMAGYNGTFFFPVSGRLGDLADALAKPIANRIHCGDPVTEVDLRRRRVRTAGGATAAYDVLISTIPLSRLVEITGLPVAAPDLFAATTILNVRVGVRGSLATAYHWVYVAEPELPFHRIGFPENLNGRTCPAGCTSLSIEYTIPQRGKHLSVEAVATAAVDDLTRRGLIQVEERLFHDELRISPAYVVYRARGRASFQALTRTLRERGIRLAGRFGTWDYLSVEEAFASGVTVARACVAAAT